MPIGWTPRRDRSSRWCAPSSSTSRPGGSCACINNTGPGLGAVGPAQNYAGLSDFQTWTLAITMLLGRLEILTVAVIFTPYFWRQ